MLKEIFNLSINTGIYPNSLKISKVIPIFKKGDPTSVNNYWQISIHIPIEKKIFDKIVYFRLISYIENINFFINKDMDSRRNHSTEHALREHSHIT